MEIRYNDRFKYLLSTSDGTGYDDTFTNMLIISRIDSCRRQNGDGRFYASC